MSNEIVNDSVPYVVYESERARAERLLKIDILSITEK